MQIPRPVRRQPGSILGRVAGRVRGITGSTGSTGSAGGAGRVAVGDPTPDTDHGPTCDGRCAGNPDHAAVDPRARVPHLQVIRPEAGITTAEYAVGTAAGAGLAGLLYTMLSGGFGDQLLTTLFDHVLGLLGIG